MRGRISLDIAATFLGASLIAATMVIPMPVYSMHHRDDCNSLFKNRVKGDRELLQFPKCCFE